EAVDLSLDLANGQGLEAAVTGALDAGPARRALDGQPPEVVAQAVHAIRAALAPLQQGQTVPLGAAVWVVTAAKKVGVAAKARNPRWARWASEHCHGNGPSAQPDLRSMGLQGALQ